MCFHLRAHVAVHATFTPRALEATGATVAWVIWHMLCRVLTVMSRDELLTELALIVRQLESSDESTADLLQALIDTARAARLPAEARRDDSLRFVEGDASVHSATWEQCGGLVHALEHGYVASDRSFIARVAARLFDLLPTHWSGQFSDSPRER